ncbi:MAG: T9SS type A sorting domain-containing protein [Bacteroidia bacterium]|nr:T9SS type A sorting domain-containing protein [Bacteroidia bacterium]
MNKKLLSTFALGAALITAGNLNAQTRYMDEVFSDVSKTSNIVYDSNYAINILYGNVPGLPPIFKEGLKCDVYTPVGDTETKRPLIILAHTGSYLPAVVNKQTTGNKNDSAIVGLANRFAKMGYVVVAMNYRLGWNPQTTVQEQATEQLIKATYRGLQDARNCIRFFRSNASTYGIDTSKIVLGGQGTGGYISLAFGSVSTREDIETNLKFLRGDASPMVSVDTLGDWTGVGGAAPFNDPADASVASNAHMTFNYGGAMGDTAWMKATSLPVVSMHTTRDPFAPYKTGNVIVPTTGVTVIPNASGAYDVVRKANALGINNKLNKYYYLDPISSRADEVNPDENNVFGFETSFPFEGSPWEWWSRPIMQATPAVPYAGSPNMAPLFGMIPANGREADSLSMLTNPFMSAGRGNTYLDTIANYIAPRIAVQFDLTGDYTLNAFNLLSPATGTSVDIFQNSTDFVVAKWEKASTAEGVENVWVLDLASGNFEDPLLEVPVGDQDSVVFTQTQVWDLLTQLGLGVDQTANLKWTVGALNARFGREANSAFNINLTKRQPVGLKDADYSRFLNLYPNPASSNIRVSLEVSNPATEATIIDLLGRQVRRVENMGSNQFDINLNGLGAGVYFMNVKTQNGSTASRKFIVQ